MPRARRSARPPSRRSSKLGAIETRFHLFTYALSRIPPNRLPLLALYAYAVVRACEAGWIDREATGKAGQAVVGVLSMVTGLLLSYNFSNSVSKWEQGKKVWVDVRTTIRDAVRTISISEPSSSAPSPSVTMSSVDDLDDLSEERDSEDKSGPEVRSLRRSNRQGSRQASSPSSTSSKMLRTSPTPMRGVTAGVQSGAEEKVHELTGLFLGFAFALQHHLHNTRPLPQPPLCDLLPPAYLTSLKRTEARVRFADENAVPQPDSDDCALSDSASPISHLNDPFRPGLKRRGTGPTTRAQMKAAGADEWDLSTLAGSATSVLSKVSNSSNPDDDKIFKQQLSQLNIPRTPSPLLSSEKNYEYGFKTPTSPAPTSPALSNTTPRPKSNLTAPNPPNLPLALLRLMESYSIGLATVSRGKGGWSESKRDRLLGEVKSLAHLLGEAERLSSNPPPLPLSLHLAHLLLIYIAALPCSLLCNVGGPLVIVITILAGWCLFGLEALVKEVGGVYGISENHHPLQEYAQQILIESLEIYSSFLRYYRSRLISRLGEEDLEVCELDRRFRRSTCEIEEWTPSFAV
ncbi:hypothetical protein BD324DRAFT_237270 [Kockovaella imperatae]|uniref:Bestrophin, RFP-TM, chloride channel-domain-containing protein n=1 Tax=Kockovaella imperatae TaxID=4999 RepID=A0A1Y1UPB1_9TREE|nr:hypothetical protein BD324DRAFT_237270 [Kockovaella imperatae]ORX39822.1 hypothetical protein BD324DRAFT_237270 [Kockovaella imperatae]